jgi:hypothetical protein
MVGTFSDWAALADGPSFTLSFGAVPDLNGNASATSQGSVSLVPLGAPLVTHDFESGLSLSATGKTTLESSADVCESGACLSLGPGNKCTGAGGTIRGLLDTTGKTQVRLRSRVVASATTAVPEFQIRLIAPTGAKNVSSVGHFDSTATTPVDGLGYGNSFGDDVVALPDQSAITGFEITLPSSGGGYFCSPGATATLIVEQVSAE